MNLATRTAFALRSRLPQGTVAMRAASTQAFFVQAAIAKARAKAEAEKSASPKQVPVKDASKKSSSKPKQDAAKQAPAKTKWIRPKQEPESSAAKKAKAKTSTLHLIDSGDWIYRAFYALPKFLHGRNGTKTGAVMGFSSSLLALARTLGPNDRIAVAFDSGRTWRNTAEPFYKSGRKRPEAIVSQFPQCRELAAAFLGAQHCLSVKGMEADDIIAELASSCTDCDQVVIHTRDQDFYQLVSEMIIVKNKVKSEFIHYGPSEVEEKFGISPNQLLDYWALTGQSADAIKGVEGIGPGTARKLITAVGTLNDIWDARNRKLVECTVGSRLADRMLTDENRSLVDLGKTLMKLPVDPDRLPGSWTPPPSETLAFKGLQKEGRQHLLKLGFKSQEKTYAKALLA